MFRSSIIRLAVAAFAALAFAAMPSSSQAASGSVRLQITKASLSACPAARACCVSPVATIR